MSTELRGKVKPKEWLRAHCKDDSDTHRARQKARRDFKKRAREEDREPDERVIDVASPDVLGEAFENGESGAEYNPADDEDYWL